MDNFTLDLKHVIKKEMEEDILSAPTSEEESPKLSCMSHCEPNCSLDQRNGMKRQCNGTEVPGEETDKKLNSSSDLKQDISHEMRETSNLNHFQGHKFHLDKRKNKLTV
ncbi:uncharacterized protein LOC106075327 isoform X2 [Biomphalaria glabrata]|uniref:Uncharacterized protein LOC106075327 isoform X2 n=1 Tax=Biomphalaria glabrata TaxID=6526 RepID=A0A9W2YCQ8_BIOGL|nr:uncharacterized protein LOC106075327 isoform X2 [Biomphalaria glabrata]